MSVFDDFPGLENLEKKFKGFQGPARALRSESNMNPICLNSFRIKSVRNAQSS